jgi:acetyl esterase/lipase
LVARFAGQWGGCTLPFDRQAGVEATLLVVPGAGHGFIPSAEAEKRPEFFDRHLK